MTRATRAARPSTSRRPSRPCATATTWRQPLTQVLGTNLFNEIQTGYVGFYWVLEPKVKWANHPYGLPTGTPILSLRGYTIGQGHTFTHEFEDVENYTIKDSLTFSKERWGRQNFKVGGFYGYQGNPVFLCNRCMGSFDMQGGPIPSNIEQIIPVWNDVSTWNLDALAPIIGLTRWASAGDGRERRRPSRSPVGRRMTGRSHRS